MFRRPLPFAALGLGLGVIVSIALGSSLLKSSGPQANTEALAIHGRGSFTAYHADGTIFVQREINNTLTSGAVATIAGCASGVNTSNHIYGRCLNFTPELSILDLSPGKSVFVTKTAANAMAPAGCNQDQGCTGWQTTATFDTEITAAMNVTHVQAGSGGATFDSIFVSPSIPLSPGDRIIVTITFTISTQ